MLKEAMFERYYNNLLTTYFEKFRRGSKSGNECKLNPFNKTLITGSHDESDTRQNLTSHRK